MRVKPNQLEHGCILSSDVICNSGQTLMRKKTVLTLDYINVLHVFLIESVDVEAVLVNGQPFNPREVIEVEDDISIDEPVTTSFMDLYIQAVQTYKKQFQSWQAGMKVDILTIRKILLPLLEKINENPNELILIHHYATKEDYIFHHSVSVGVLSGYLGLKLNFSKAEVIQLGIAGMMADSGMAKIPYSILDKRGVLNHLEYEEIKKHPLYSYQMLKDITGVTDGVLLAILQHHEREDGSGYPMAITTNKLHKFSKVIAVVDVFHAMTSERYYKQKQSPYRVIELIMKDDFGKFDIKVLQMLAELIANYSVGTKVRLNNGDIAEIVFIEPLAPIRPMVKIDHSGDFVKLANRSDLYIEEPIEI